MPYLITDSHPDCSGWGVIKEDNELIACHETKQEAIDQAVAISLAEETEFLGEREARDLPENYRPATSDDVPEGRACGNCRFFNEDMVDSEGRAYCTRWEDYVRGGFYCNAWEPRESYRQDDPASTPAPPEDQIEGSEENEPGSAEGPGGDIELSEATETALRNKVSEHNEQMEADDRPAWTRTTYGQLAAVYRRGAGAYSTSHRPGVSRAAWAMARVNAYLYLLRNGEPQSAAYITDNDLLPEDHPKSTRSVDVAELTHPQMSEYEDRQVNLVPPAYMRAAARQGLRYYEEGLAGDGLTRRTVTEARQMARGDALTPDKWTRIAAWIARHMGDLEAPAADPQSDDYPSPGVVAHLLWGSGPSMRAARRAQAYAEGVVARLEEENEGRAKGMAVSKLETRTNPMQFEVREDGDGGLHFEGYAAIFDSPSEPLPFIERIQRGAFQRSIKARNDIKMLWNHDAGQPLASTRSGTLSLYEDERGLRVEAELAPTTLGRDIAVLTRTKVVDSMSFGFSVIRDSWNEDGSERTLHSVRLHEVSLVSFPAYQSTAGTTSVRGLEKVARSVSVDADALADTLLKVESGQNISADEREVLAKVLEQLGPQDEKPAESESDANLLALKKARLKMLEL